MSGLLHRRGARFVPRRASLASLVAVGALLAGSFGLNSVGAQSIDDARAEAERIANDLSGTREQLEALAEDFNRATEDLAVANAQVAENQALLDANQAALEQSRSQLRDYAVAAYVSGGSQELDGFFGGEASTVDRRLNYIHTASGNQKQIADDLAAAKQRYDKQLARLRDAQAAAEAEQARIDRSRAEAAALEATTTELLDQAEGRLSALVAEADARRQAEEQAAAQAAAQAARDATEFAPAASPGRGSTSSYTPAAVVATAPAYTPPPGLRPEAARALQAAMSQLGVDYVWGGSSPSQGFDCSGLMYWAYAQAGVSISRPADYQRDDAVRISYEDLQPGDLVFYGEPPSHVGMYVGNDQILNAPQTGDVVSIKNMFYSSKPMTYGRIA